MEIGSWSAGVSQVKFPKGGLEWRPSKSLPSDNGTPDLKMSANTISHATVDRHSAQTQPTSHRPEPPLRARCTPVASTRGNMHDASSNCSIMRAQQSSSSKPLLPRSASGHTHTEIYRDYTQTAGKSRNVHSSNPAEALHANVQVV